MFGPSFIPRGFTPVSVMLVCQCNAITDREIVRVIRDLLADDPWQIIVPAKVYRELEKRCRCSGCVPNVVDLITRVTHEYHLEIAEAPVAAQAPPVMAPPRRKFKGAGHERRSAGYRTAQ
jgi:bacterioferritin-associated ferredoxin